MYALDMLLSLSTHPSKPTRNAAILTLKRWVPDTKPLGDTVLAFALQLLRRLEEVPTGESKSENDDVKEISGTFANVLDGEVKGGLPIPETDLHVLQHLELLLALCSKMPDLLDK